MKMLHTTVDSGAVIAGIAAGGVIGYSHITRQLSAKYGRNMPQACTYRVVGLRFTLVNTADAVADVGGSIAVQPQWITPSRHRVAAHERIMREYVEDVRDDSDYARGRQLYVAFDGVQPVDAAESVLMRSDAASRVIMLGANAAGIVGMFADYNARFPKPEGTGGVNQPDQDLYTDPASQVTDSVTGHATMTSSWFDTFGDLIAGGSGITGRFNGPTQVWDWEWWAPAGTYLPVMCGIVKWIASDSWYPVLQQGTDSTLTGGIIDPLTPVRGSFTGIWQTIVEGWTPLSKK